MKTLEISRCGEPAVAVTIDTLNWGDYQHLPAVEVRCWYDDEHLVVSFSVVENFIKASFVNDNAAVCRDSCVEVFIRPDNSRYYYNFEVTPIGTLLAAKRLSRKDFAFMSDEQRRQVGRVGDSGSEPFTKEGGGEWNMTLRIPFRILEIDPAPGTVIFANFYKCGDETKFPHYVSWNGIDTPSPDFHRPEFFGKLILK